MDKLPKPKTDRFITVGIVGSTYGIRGWLKIHSYTDPYTNILDYRPWYLLQNDTWTVVDLADCKKHANTIIAHFSGCDNPETARRFTNRHIGIPYSHLPALHEDEFYWADLIGLEVYNEHQQYIGKIDSLFATGANDVMVIKNETAKKETLIPYVLQHIIVEIDLNKRTMIVSWNEE